MLKRGKKAQGLSIQTLVVVALIALVFIFLAYLFISRYTAAKKEIGVVSNPLEYKAACLARYPNDTEAYNNCVERCKQAAENKQPREECRLGEKK